MEFIIGCLVTVLIMTLCLSIALKIIGYSGTFQGAFIICGCAFLCTLIPVFGWILAIIMFYFMLNQYKGVTFWPNGILVSALSIGVGIALMYLIRNVLKI